MRERAILLGYYVPNRFDRELDFLRELAGPEDDILCPNLDHKMGFPASVVADLQESLPNACHHLEAHSIIEALSRYKKILRFSSNALNYLHQTPIGARIHFIESYGGFDYPNILPEFAFPKSRFSQEFGLSVPKSLLNSAKASKRTVPIGPIWYGSRSEKAAMECTRVGLFFKNAFFVEKKAQQWFGKRRGIEYGIRHRRLISDCVNSLSGEDLVVCLHPNHGGFRDQELSFYRDLGFTSEQILFDSESYNAVGVAVGFSTHARADCNWFGKPFIEVSTPRMPRLLAWDKRIKLSRTVRKLRREIPQVMTSAYLPFYYGGSATTGQLADEVCRVRDTYCRQDCLRIGELLLGPSMNNINRASLINQHYYGR